MQVNAGAGGAHLQHAAALPLLDLAQALPRAAVAHGVGAHDGDGHALQLHHRLGHRGEQQLRQVGVRPVAHDQDCMRENNPWHSAALLPQLSISVC